MSKHNEITEDFSNKERDGLYDKLHNRKLIVYGKSRIQKDFEYIFSDLKPVYYIDNTVLEHTSMITSESNTMEREVYPLDRLKMENPEQIYIIICKWDTYHAAKCLEGYGLQERTHFCKAEDLLCLLDKPLADQIGEKEVIVWGTGNSARELFAYYNRQDKPEFEVSFFIDNDAHKQGQTLMGKRIVAMDSIKDWSGYFVIIAIADYRRAEWESIARKKGFWESAIHYRKIMWDKPSELLRRTMFDRKQYAIGCCGKTNDLRILINGDITPCGTCRGITLGNVFLDSPQTVWDSIYEKIYRLSMLNATHSFCRGTDCPFLVNREITEEIVKPSAHYKDSKPERPRMLIIENDAICNLRCKTCRDEIFAERDCVRDSLCEAIIEQYAGYARRLVLNGSGEAIVSPYGLKIIQSNQCQSRKNISILSNGNAFTPSCYQKLFGGYDFIDLSISIDAATPETYQKLRRGGDWNRLMENLQFMKELKKKGKVGFFQINFVVQKENVKEMALFVLLGKELGVDRVLFNKLENWHYEEDFFKNESVLDRDNRISEQYKNYFEDDILKDSIIDWTNIAQALDKSAKDAYMY